MSREDLISLMKIVQEQTKKKDTEIQLLKEKQKELEFLNAMLSDRLTLAQRKQFGASRIFSICIYSCEQLILYAKKYVIT